jgi:hypothetical protein
MATNFDVTRTPYFDDGTPVPTDPDMPSGYTTYAKRGLKAIAQIKDMYPDLVSKRDSSMQPYTGQLPGVGIDAVCAEADAHWVKGTMAGARAVEWGRAVRALMTPEEVAIRRQAERDDDQPRYGFIL